MAPMEPGMELLAPEAALLAAATQPGPALLLLCECLPIASIPRPIANHAVQLLWVQRPKAMQCSLQSVAAGSCPNVFHQQLAMSASARGGGASLESLVSCITGLLARPYR